MTKNVITALILIAVLLAVLYVGKFYSASIPPWESETGGSTTTTEDASVIAQGKIEPLGGVFKVFAPQGQTVSKYLKNEAGQNFAAGVSVSKGDELVELAGQQLLKQQLNLANARAMDADREMDAAIVKAKLQLRAAQLAKKEAEFKLAQVQSNKDQTVNQKKLDHAKTKLDRLQNLADDPETQNLVSQQDLMDKKLAWEDAKLELEKAQTQIVQAEKAAQFAVEAATENVDDAEKALNEAKSLKANPPGSLTAAIEMAKTQLEISRLRSPVSGEILKIYVKEGEAVVNTPLMQIGNLNQLQCKTEVSDRMVGKVKKGQRAKLSSPAFGDKVLNGTVIEVGNMVGDGSLGMANPLAMVDKKTVDVIVQIDDADVATARSFINLQVDVEIEFK